MTVAEHLYQLALSARCIRELSELCSSATPAAPASAPCSGEGEEEWQGKKDIACTAPIEAEVNGELSQLDQTADEMLASLIRKKRRKHSSE